MICKDAFATNVKIINDTEFYLRVKVYEDQGLVGIISSPFLDVDIEDNERTKFEFELISNPSKDDLINKISTGQRCFNRARRFYLHGQDLCKLVVRHSSTSACTTSVVADLADGLLNISNVAKKERDVTYFERLLVKGKDYTKNDPSQIAKNTTGSICGFTSIGINALDWFLGKDSRRKLCLSIKPSVVEGYSSEFDKDLVLKITEKEIVQYWNNRNPDPLFIECTITNKSSKKIVCKYVDEDDDEVLCLINSQCPEGTIRVGFNHDPFIQLYEVIDYNSTNTHHLLKATSGVLNIGTSVLLPATLLCAAPSAGIGAYDLYNGVKGIAGNIRNKPLNSNIPVSFSRNNIEINENNIIVR